MENVGLSSPWITRAREINALFGQDPDISVSYSEEGDNPAVTIRVDDAQKADALDKLLPDTYQFGNVTLFVYVVPSNMEMSRVALLQHAFAGNPALSSIELLKTPIGEMTYVLFTHEVVQYFNDDLMDIYGVESTLYEDIARHVFDNENMNDVSFCTELEETSKVSDAPLGEWP